MVRCMYRCLDSVCFTVQPKLRSVRVLFQGDKMTQAKVPVTIRKREENQ